MKKRKSFKGVGRSVSARVPVRGVSAVAWMDQLSTAGRMSDAEYQERRRDHEEGTAALRRAIAERIAREGR